MKITIDHIRYATGRQLAELIGTTEDRISQWTSQKVNISETMLNRALTRGVPKAVLIDGMDARRADLDLAREYQAEVESYLFEIAQEPATA